VRVPLVGPGETKGSLRMRLAFEGAVDTAPARLTLDAGRARYPFDGFGGNLCWDNGKGNRAVQKYVFENLQHGWARTEMKLQAWDAAGRQASGDVRFDLETMQRLQRMGIPYVISVWRLPERFYVDAYERPRGDRFRVIDGAKWDELNEFIGGYLQYAKKEFGVEPDLFSFNEPNIGVQVGQTPEQHTEQIRKMGAAFRRMGLKTKMLLADAVPARDSHVFALDAANDAEALQYVGAVGFHSWGGATAKQYAAWGDLAEWLGVPLLVTELGVDSQAFATNSWDSYHYGIREAQMTQEILLHARPRGTQFWQYTDDFALAKLQADGTAAPTARFWLMKHFTDLTPLRSEALGTASDQAGVLFTAFRTGERYAMHVVNRGGGREARIAGVPAGRWQVTETTEGAAFVKKGAVPGGGEVVLRLPARSVVTLVRE
jgi:O-glycosyl hydrolase